MHREQHGFGVADRVSRRTGARIITGFVRELLQLLPAARVAEDDVVCGARISPEPRMLIRIGMP